MHFYAFSAVAVLLVPVLLARRAHAERTGGGWARFELPLVLGAIALFSAYLAGIARGVVTHLPEWDFLAFWVRMNAATQGLDLYDPASYVSYAERFTASNAFVKEVLELGYNYPPQTMLWMQPFGYLPPHAAALAWSAFHLALMVVNVGLLSRIVMPGRGVQGLALAGALMLMLPATASTVRTTQTNQVVLLLVLLLWRDLARSRAGVWLALLPVVKPFLGMLWLWPLARGQWGTLGVTFAVSLALAGVAALIYGIEAYVGFYQADLAGRHPNWTYTQMLNQSLHATMVRLFRVPLESSGPTQFLGPTLVSAGLLLAAAWRVWRVRAQAWAWALSLLLVTVLMVFPSSLRHYHLLLLPVMLLAWSERDRLRGGATTAIAAITLTWVLVSIPGGPWLFLAYAGWWAICWVGAAGRLTAEAPPVLRATA